MVKTYKSQGFTLIELMVVIAVVAVLVVMLNGLQGFVNKGRLTAQINTLVSAISMTRNEAIKRGQTASICSSANGVACNGGNTWQVGWIVFDDVNGDANVDPADTIIRVFPALTGGNTLIYNNGQRLTYQENGRLSGVFNGTFILTDPTVANGKTVIISGVAGRARFLDQ